MKTVKLQAVKEVIVNERFVEKAKSADGFVFGSPVDFAHPSGRLLTFMDRAFYSGGAAFRSMYNIGKNMAWLMKCLNLGKKHGFVHPENKKILTNFIW